MAILVLLVLALGACFVRPTHVSLRPGLTKQQVMETRGYPADYASYADGSAVWYYHDGTVVWFRDGRVTDYSERRL